MFQDLAPFWSLLIFKQNKLLTLQVSTKSLLLFSIKTLKNDMIWYDMTVLMTCLSSQLPIRLEIFKTREPLWVMGIEEGTCWNEHWVLYGNQFDNKFHIKKKTVDASKNLCLASSAKVKEIPSHKEKSCPQDVLLKLQFVASLVLILNLTSIFCVRGEMSTGLEEGLMKVTSPLKAPVEWHRAGETFSCLLGIPDLT